MTPADIPAIIDAHVHLNMKESSPLPSLEANLASCRIGGGVLILNSAEEKKYLSGHLHELAASGIRWHIGVLVDLKSGPPETALLNALSACSIPFSIKVHSRFSGLCASDIPSLIKTIDEMPGSWENIIVDGFYYGARLEHQIAMELAIALSRHYSGKKIVYAHAGGIHILETLVHLRERKNIYYDFSLSCNYLLHSSLAADYALFLKHNKLRVMFGSDYPDFFPADALSATRTICETARLSPDEQNAVFRGNAENVYTFS